MKPPKCRSCGIEHWGSVCSNKKSTGSRDETKARSSVEPSKVSQAAPVDTTSKALFDRSAYQRQYMADQRTIKRLGLSVTVAEWRKQNVNLHGES